MGLAAQNPVDGKARSENSSHIGRKVTHRHGQIERRRHPAIRLDCALPKSQAEMVEDQYRCQTRCGPAPADAGSRPSRPLADSILRPHGLRALTVPAVIKRTSPLPGLRSSRVGSQRERVFGAGERDLHRSGDAASQFPTGNNTRIEHGMGQRVDDHRAQFGTACRGCANEPDIPRGDSQIGALMPAGFRGDHTGGHRPGDRLGRSADADRRDGPSANRAVPAGTAPPAAKANVP